MKKQKEQMGNTINNTKPINDIKSETRWPYHTPQSFQFKDHFPD
jgi:hypothetical protein